MPTSYPGRRQTERPFGLIRLEGDGTTAVSLVVAAKDDASGEGRRRRCRTATSAGDISVQGDQGPGGQRDDGDAEAHRFRRPGGAGLTVTGATADGAAMGAPGTGYVLETLGNPGGRDPVRCKHGGKQALRRSTSGQADRHRDTAALKAYYDAPAVPGLPGVSEGCGGWDEPVYIKGSTVTGGCGEARYQSVDVDMTVPDDFRGAYTVAGQIGTWRARDDRHLILIVTVDTTGRVLTITGATADGGDGRHAGGILPTTNNGPRHLVQFAAGTTADELANQYRPLLTGSTVTADFLKTYYAWKGVPEPYGVSEGAADGTNPFVYIKVMEPPPQ